MNKPTYRQEDETLKELEGLPETTETDLQDELEKLDAWKGREVNEGMDSLTFGDY